MCCCSAGFHAAPSTFFTFYLISIATMLQMSAVYRLLASACPNTDIGTAAGAPFTALLPQDSSHLGATSPSPGLIHCFRPRLLFCWGKCALLHSLGCIACKPAYPRSAAYSIKEVSLSPSWPPVLVYNLAVSFRCVNFRRVWGEFEG